MIRFAVDHPVATWMLFTALIVTGVYAVPRLNIEAMPETLETGLAEIAPPASPPGAPASSEGAPRTLVEQALQDELPDLDPKLIYSDPKLLSPAQVEKVMTKMKVKKKDRERIMPLLVEKPDGGLTLTPDTDRRDAIKMTPSIDLLPDDIFNE